jgi:branched-chain amino acid transport system substrate-binding protein
MHTRLGWIVAIAVVGIFAASMGVVHAQTKPIKIGQIIPITGEAAESGKYHKQGAEIAIDKINASGGVK